MRPAVGTKEHKVAFVTCGRKLVVFVNAVAQTYGCGRGALNAGRINRRIALNAVFDST